MIISKYGEFTFYKTLVSREHDRLRLFDSTIRESYSLYSSPYIFFFNLTIQFIIS